MTVFRKCAVIRLRRLNHLAVAARRLAVAARREADALRETGQPGEAALQSAYAETCDREADRLFEDTRLGLLDLRDDREHDRDEIVMMVFLLSFVAAGVVLLLVRDFAG
jgi:hypothetical protein